MIALVFVAGLALIAGALGGVLAAGIFLVVYAALNAAIEYRT